MLNITPMNNESNNGNSPVIPRYGMITAANNANAIVNVGFADPSKPVFE